MPYLFTSYIRLLIVHIYAAPICLPTDVGSCVKRERIQRHLTNRIRVLNNLSCEGRLTQLGMTLLSCRCSFLLSFFVYTLIHNLREMPLLEAGLQLFTNCTRASGLKLFVPKPFYFLFHNSLILKLLLNETLYLTMQSIVNSFCIYLRLNYMNFHFNNLTFLPCCILQVIIFDVNKSLLLLLLLSLL